jgi:hypothetical protein
MATINIEGRKVKVDDSFLQMSPDEQSDIVDEIAESIGAQSGAQQDLTNDQRIEQAHDGSNDIRAVQGDLAPVSKLQRNGETIPGSLEFDSNAGVLGGLKRVASMPKDVLTGEMPQYLPDGTPNPEINNAAAEFAMALSPVGPGARLAKRAIPALTRKQRVTGEAQSRVDDADKFGIQLTRGQATDDVNIQSFEQDALSGGRGLPAQSALVQQRAKQDEQINNAVNSLRDRIAPGQSDDAIEIAENVGSAVASRADRLKAISQKFYNRAEESGTVIQRDALTSLSDRMAARLDEKVMMLDGEVSDDMSNIKRIKGYFDKLASSEDADQGIDWRLVERGRQALVAAADNPGTEKGGILAMKKEMDDWIVDTVVAGLATGDKKFGDDLLKARKFASKNFDITKNKNAIIKKMADNQMNEVQIANVLYGASKVGGRSDSANIVNEIKKLIGPDHPQIEALKRGVMTRLFKNSEGENKATQKIASDIYDLANGNGRALFKSLFGEQNRLEMVKFARVLRNLKPNDLSTNPSRSGQTVARRAVESLTRIAPIIGFAVGDLTGMVAGAVGQGVVKSKAGAVARKLINKPVPGARQPLPALPLSVGQGLRLPALSARPDALGQGSHGSPRLQNILGLLPPGTA